MSGEYPVAPEFIESLQETAMVTAVAALRVLSVPDDVILLVQNMRELGHYLALCAGGEPMLAERGRRLNIEGLTIGTVNAVVRCGGVFVGGETVSKARRFPPLRLKKRVEKVSQP